MINTKCVAELGILLSLPVYSMQLYSNCKNNFTPLLEILCVYIQIRNDYLSLYSEKVSVNRLIYRRCAT